MGCIQVKFNMHYIYLEDWKQDNHITIYVFLHN